MPPARARQPPRLRPPAPRNRPRPRGTSASFTASFVPTITLVVSVVRRARVYLLIGSVAAILIQRGGQQQHLRRSPHPPSRVPGARRRLPDHLRLRLGDHPAARQPGSFLPASTSTPTTRSVPSPPHRSGCCSTPAPSNAPSRGPPCTRTGTSVPIEPSCIMSRVRERRGVR